MNKVIVAALTSHLLDDAEPVRAGLWREVRQSSGEDLVQWTKRNLDGQDAAQVESLLSKTDMIEEKLAELELKGISAVSEFDEEYPQRWIETLGSKRPPLIFAGGNLSLLNALSFGIVGSRDVDDDGAAFAAEAAAAAVEAGYVVVSGGARGVDQIAMRAAFEAGGSSVGLMADSLAKAVAGAAEALEAGSVCLASAFAPSAGFNVANAMSRNKQIYGHSVATLVVSSAERTGGTWAGAEEALKHGYCRVLVREGDGAPAGNAALVRLGGTPVSAPGGIVEAMGAPVPGTLF